MIAIACLACGCGPGDITQSGAGFIGEYSEVVCARLAECAGGGFSDADIQECADAVTSDVCASSQSTCGTTYTVPGDEWHDCLDAVSDQMCDAIERGELPVACLEIEELW